MAFLLYNLSYVRVPVMTNFVYILIQSNHKKYPTKRTGRIRANFQQILFDPIHRRPRDFSAFLRWPQKILPRISGRHQ